MPKFRAPGSGALVWLGDALPGVFKLTVVGTRLLMAEHHGGIIVFSPREICLRAGRGCVTVSGEGLEIRQARADALIICGAISAIALPEEA